MVTAVLVVVGAYLLGGFPTATLVGRRSGFDPAEGSGNPGASNSLRLGGVRAGALVLIGDVGKGAVAAAVGLAAGGRAWGFAAGAAAVLGHVAPLTQRFRGGKGVATAMGMVVVLAPVAAAIGALVWLVAAAVTRKAALGSISMMTAVVLVDAVVGRHAWETMTVGGIALLVVVRHRGNLARLRRGEEPSLMADRVTRRSRGAVERTRDR